MCGSSRTKTGCNSKREPGRATTNISPFTKDTLEIQVCLSICHRNPSPHFILGVMSQGAATLGLGPPRTRSAHGVANPQFECLHTQPHEYNQHAINNRSETRGACFFLAGGQKRTFTEHPIVAVCIQEEKTQHTTFIRGKNTKPEFCRNPENAQ